MPDLREVVGMAVLRGIASDMDDGEIADAVLAAIAEHGAESLLAAYEDEIGARGIPSIPEYRQARLDLMAGTLKRLAIP